MAHETRKIFWIRGSRHHPLSEQERAAAAWGADVILRDGVGRESWQTLIRSVARSGDAIGMTYLTRIGSSREAIRCGLADAAKRGCVIVETATGRRSDDAAAIAQAALDAADDLSQEARALTRKQARGAANKRWSEQRSKRLSRDDARTLWDNTTAYPRVDDVLPEARGWTRVSLYRAFGARGTSAAKAPGRPRKIKPR